VASWVRREILFGGPLLVGGGAVEGGHGDVVEAKIDAELRGVVDEVIEEHLTVGEGARAVGDDLVAVAELPLCIECRIRGVDERLAALGSRLVELLESVFARGEFE